MSKKNQCSNNPGRGLKGRRLSSFKGSCNGKKTGQHKGKGSNDAANKCKGECAALGNNVCFIGEARLADNCTKVTEAIINHTRRTFVDGDDVKQSLENREEFDFKKVMPTMPTPIATQPGEAAASESTKTTGLMPGWGSNSDDEKPSVMETQHDKADMTVFQAEVKQCVDGKGRHRSNMNKARAIVIGQCAMGLKNRTSWRT